MFLRKFLSEPGNTQAEVLKGLLTRAAGTVWGRKHGYASIATEPDVVRAYQERVPLHSYEDMRPFVEQIRDGARDVLWPGTVRYFAASSGTTSSGRIVPVSSAMLAQNRRFSMTVIANYLAKTGRSRILFGKHLSLPGWIEDDRPDLGTRIGQISAILAESSAMLSAPWRAITNELGFIEDWEEKMAAIADHTTNQDVRLIVIAPSWGQVLFRLVTERYERKTGICATIGEIWPNLTAVVTGGVALSGYRDIFTHYIGRDDVDFIETYGASEGFISFQNDLDDPAMLIHLNNGVFFEFVPIDELDSASPPRLTIEEVETDTRYAVFLSSNSGFWSYGLGDVVRFTSMHPHKIVVAGRTVDMLDKYGEAVFGDEAKVALEKTCEQTGTRYVQYHVTHAPSDPTKTPSHHWLIEFEQAPADLGTFASVLDEALKRAGHHYDDRREGGAFGPPMITALEPGTFFRWLASTGKRVSVQTKVPAMREEPDLAQDVIRFSNAGAQT